MPDPTDKRERLADIQHEIWSHWMRYQLSICAPNPDGSMTIPADKVARWQRQMGSPYSALSAREQESDRIEADKILKVLRELGEE